MLVLASVHLMGSVMGLVILLGKGKVQVSVKASAAAWADLSVVAWADLSAVAWAVLSAVAWADLSAVAWVNEARKRPHWLSPRPM